MKTKRKGTSASGAEGEAMHALMTTLFPICRSITGQGLRETLRILRTHIPLKNLSLASGTRILDWTVPREWNIRDAYIADSSGRRIVDFRKNNLHVVGYSTPVDKMVELSELNEHLHSLEGMPDAIPYVTSYYKPRWGFCLSHRQRLRLKKGRYRVCIDSDLRKGRLDYGELILPGASRKEVFLSTYVCHPSMANNELSGPVVTTFLTKWIMSRPRRYTYRIVFIPETIGAIAYLSRNLKKMKKNIVAGFNVTCIGDERTYSYLPSRRGDTLADRVALNVLRFKHPGFIRHSFLDRGSDERQYCSPGIDLPVASLMRSKYATYPEYHTSLDDLSMVTPQGLQGGYDALKDCIELIEHNDVYRTTCLGEPQMGRRGLYPDLGTNMNLENRTKDNLDLLAYADGTLDLIALSETLKIPARRLFPAVDQLLTAGLLKKKKV